MLLKTKCPLAVNDNEHMMRWDMNVSIIMDIDEQVKHAHECEITGII